MKLIFPEKMKLTMEKIEKDKWKISYIEKYSSSKLEAMETTRKLLTQASKTFLGSSLKVRRLKNGISVSQEGSHEEMADFIVSEFLPQSNLGKRTLADIWAFMGVVAGMVTPEKLASSLPQPGVVGELRKEDSKEVT